MLESFKATAKVPGGLGFVFDIVIAHINLTNINVEEISKLMVDIKFINNNIKITSSRINVSEFKSGSSFEFNKRPSALKTELFRNPLECQIYYDGKSVGICTFLWPESFINCIAGDCGRELMHCEEADIKSDHQKGGRMEIIARLQIKCYEFMEKDILQPKTTRCNQADNVISPNDVMFVVGEDKNNSIACTDIDVIPASESGSSANATCLDLSDFRAFNGKTIANTDILDTLDAKCCKTKYKQIVDNLMDNSKQQSPCSAPNKSTQQSWQFSCEKSRPVDCISDSRYASCSSTDSYNPCQCISDDYISEGKSMTCNNEGLKDKSIKRYCPLCHENVTWLPKFAACPKCGYRPIPYSTEKTYDYELTADRILQEFSNKKPKDNGFSEQISNGSLGDCGQKPQCRCTCKDGKICAHCRIKKLCEDIFQQPHKGEGDCGKCEAKSSDLYNVCKTSSQDCRPYLTKVFQELRELYDLKESKKEKENIVSNESKEIYVDANASRTRGNEPHEKNQIQEIEDKPSKPRINKNNLNKERKKILMRNFQNQESCKGQIFDYNRNRTYPGTKIGHKTYVNGFGGRKNVPRNMGWLWNAETNGLRAGWIPGAIRKPIKVLMHHFLTQHSPRYNCELKANCNKDNDEEEDYTKESTLHICKTNGVYYITLRPLKNTEALNECSDSDVNMKPIQFVISKNPELIERRKLKRYLKDMGFAKCVCHKPIASCCCRSFLEKKKLEYQCCRECQRRQLPNCTEALILSDTTDSEAEFSFGVTPPAGVAQPVKCFRRRKTVSTATQYEENDWKINEDEYPKPARKYFKLHNCAVGNRFGKAFGPYGSKGYSPGAVPAKGIYGPGGFILENMNGMGKGGKRGIALRGPQAFLGPDGKFNMAQYLAVKALTKSSPEEIAERKKQKMVLLKGANPPLLCKVDRRGKPVDICSTCAPMTCNALCLRDNRIC